MHGREQRENKYAWLWAPNVTEPITWQKKPTKKIHSKKKKRIQISDPNVRDDTTQRTIKQKPQQMGDWQAHKLNNFLREPSFEHNYSMSKLKECTSSMTGQSLTIAQHKDWHMGTIVYHNQGRFQTMLDVAAQFLLITTAPKQEHD